MGESDSSVQNMYFPFTHSYMMSNGYKPAPLDLSDVKLLPSQEILVDKLAENAHNVWAKDRIKQGWTYGIQQVRSTRSGLLEKLGDVIIHQNAIFFGGDDWRWRLPLHSVPHASAHSLFIESGLDGICNGHIDINSRHNSNVAAMGRFTFSWLVWFPCDPVVLCIWPQPASFLIPCHAACIMES